MFLPVKGDARLADAVEVFQQGLDLRDRAGRARFKCRAHQALHGAVVEGGEIGLAIGGAIERKGLAHSRDRAQALGADDLIDEEQTVLARHRKVHRLAQFVREFGDERSRDFQKIRAHRARQPQQAGAEHHAPRGRGRDDEFLRMERRDDALHRGAREARALGDLTKAEARSVLLQRAQNGGGAGDHLHAIAILPDHFVHGFDVRHGSPAPWRGLMGSFGSWYKLSVMRYRGSRALPPRGEA